MSPLDPRRLAPYVGERRVERLLQVATSVRERLDGRSVVNVNSAAAGGGVAEMLQTLIAYARGSGIDARWLVIEGEPDFFEVTKRIHNGLYGGPGDGGPLGPAERAVYERVIARNAPAIVGAVRPGDVVLVHDPQPAGLIALLRERGAHVAWRCHVGYDGSNEWTERAWGFVRPYVEDADAGVFSRRAFAPAWLDGRPVLEIPPSIDPFATKNTLLGRGERTRILQAAGVLAGGGMDSRVRRSVRAVREGAAPAPSTPLVVQVSRWDRMKDMAGVLTAFVEHVDPSLGARLVLAGPAVDGVDDDPEGTGIWEETLELWRSLPDDRRARVDLVAVPMDDPVENALVINALQRHAAVIVQKSLAEGFGLTVAEGMWKSRPVVASAVGGISMQVVDGSTGLLIEDPYDLSACGAAIQRLLEDPAWARKLGRNGRTRVRRRFLPDRHLLQLAEAVASLLDAPAG